MALVSHLVRRRVVVVAAVAVVALVGAGVAWWLARPGTDLEHVVTDEAQGELWKIAPRR